jgi:glutaredoxin
MKRICLWCLFVLAWPAAALCQVHSWIDKEGVRHYSSEPPENIQDVTDYRVLEGSGEIEPAVPLEKVNRAPAEKASSGVEIYTTSWCPICKKAKAWFVLNKIPYKEYDVEKSGENYAAYKRKGGKTGVPFIVVGDNRMEGFNADLIKSWLADGKKK